MNKCKPDWSRRKFIATVSSASALAMLYPFSSWAINRIDPEVDAIVTKTIGIDTHNHVDVPLISSELPGPSIDLAGEIKKSGLSAICMTFAVDYQKLNYEGEAYERFMNGLTAMDNVLATNKMKRSTNLTDIKMEHDKHIPTVVQSVEGCHFLEGKLDRVEVAYKRGLRHLGLLHDSDASVPLGDVYTNPAQFNGLTDFGADVIKECNRLGMLIDLAHASNDTINTALKITAKPVIISHTGLDTQLGNNEFMAKMMKPRLISKEQAKIVADAGGVICVWTHLTDTPIAFAQNIKAMVNVMGIDHVGIGTDTKMTPAYRSKIGNGEMPAQFHHNNDSSKHAEPSHDNKERVGERTNKVWENQTTGFYYAVVDAMLKTGFKEEEIAKIGGGNFCRVFNDATSVH